MLYQQISGKTYWGIMNNKNKKYLNELKRIRRVSDMMVTAHASLNEQFTVLSIISEIALFACSLLLAVIVFADSNLLIRYFGTNYYLLVGIFSIATFIFSFLAGLFNWKVRAEKHRYAFETYMALKFASNDLINKIKKKEHADVERFLERYYALTPAIVSIPERLFLRCKRQHVSKVYISKYLDDHPSASIIFLKIKIWIRDNLKLATAHVN